MPLFLWNITESKLAVAEVLVPLWESSKMQIEFTSTAKLLKALVRLSIRRVRFWYLTSRQLGLSKSKLSWITTARCLRKEAKIGVIKYAWSVSLLMKILPLCKITSKTRNGPLLIITTSEHQAAPLKMITAPLVPLLRCSLTPRERLFSPVTLVSDSSNSSNRILIRFSRARLLLVGALELSQRKRTYLLKDWSRRARQKRP